MIPKIHVASPLDRLGRAPDGTVQVPSRWEVAGWYAPGSATRRPRVGGAPRARRLHAARRCSSGCTSCEPATRLTSRAPTSSVRLVVQRTEQSDKQRFPTDAVYYPTLTPALRLMTCGGQFDHSTGHYRSNIIVFATLRT
jgi:hypothetical protein